MHPFPVPVLGPAVVLRVPSSSRKPSIAVTFAHRGPLLTREWSSRPFLTNAGRAAPTLTLSDFSGFSPRQNAPFGRSVLLELPRDEVGASMVDGMTERTHRVVRTHARGLSGPQRPDDGGDRTVLQVVAEHGGFPEWEKVFGNLGDLPGRMVDMAAMHDLDTNRPALLA